MSEITTKKGPVYGVDLTIDTLPIGGGMTQQLPSASDLARVKEVSERTAAGYEVLMAHYVALRASLAAVTKERDEAKAKADIGERVRLDLKAWHARLKGVPVESVSDMHGLDLTTLIHALVESRLAIAVQAERERCAKVARSFMDAHDKMRNANGESLAAANCASDIEDAILAGKEVAA